MAPGALDAPRALDASCAIELKVARRYQLGEGQPYHDALAALDERIRMRLAPSGAAVHVSAVPSTAPGAYEVSYTLSRGGSRLGGRQLASKLASKLLTESRKWNFKSPVWNGKIFSLN